MRHGDRLAVISQAEGSADAGTSNWVSPRLGIRFSLQADTLVIYHPDDRPFLSFVELDQRRQQAEQRTEQAQQQAADAEQRAEQAQQQAEHARQQAEHARQQAEQAQQQAEKLATKLRELGIDPANL
jgi:methyl-accepting chemotaxis protein